MSDPTQTQPPTLPAPERAPLVPKLTHEELVARNRRAIETLNRFMTEGDPEEQRETWELLDEALNGVEAVSGKENGA
jgi:hypothetical protein